MDILGPLPVTHQNKKFILVIGDYFTKWTEAYPIPNMEASTVAKVFVNEFVARFGAPETLHTDQGRNFESALMKEVCQLLGVTKTRTTPYHPQSDGMVERFNRTLLSMLSTAIEDDEKDWDTKLPCLMLEYRSSVHETTKETPFMLMFGREARLPVDVMFGHPAPPPSNCTQYVENLRKMLESAYQRVRQHLNTQHRRQKQIYDRKVEGVPYAVGDKVWLHSPAVPRGRSKKFFRPWQGPYIVVKVLSDVVYRIKKMEPPHRCIVVHYDRLKPYTGTKQSLEKEPTEASSEPEVAEEVEEIDYNVIYIQENVPNGDQCPADSMTTSNSQQHALPTETSHPLRCSTRNRKPPDRYGNPIPH